MTKYDIDEIMLKMKTDHAKYGGLANILSKLDPLSESFSQVEDTVLKMKKEHDAYAKYGSFANILSKLDPLSESFSQVEDTVLKMKKEQDAYAKYGSFANILSKLDPLSENFSQVENTVLKIKKEQDAYAKYGSFTNILSKLDPLSDHFKQIESIALKINDSWITHQSVAMKSMREMQINSSRQYFDIVEESIHVSDEIIDASHPLHIKKLNDQSLFINTLFLSIYILAIHSQVPLDQLLVTLAQNFLNSTLFFYFQSKYEAAKNFPNGINKNEFKNSRITIKAESLFQEPKTNSEIIENLEPYKFLGIVEEPNLHKSWLKVHVEINGEILQGYVLRRYTSPIK